MLQKIAMMNCSLLCCTIVLSASCAAALRIPVVPRDDRWDALEVDDDDGLIVSSSRRIDAKVTSSVGGVQRAQLFKACDAWAKGVRHHVDVVSSKNHSFIYLDNVKAGSSTIRQLLRSSLWVSWNQTDEQLISQSGCCSRTSSNDFQPEALRNRLKWSFVRDPIAKFESGVREAWIQFGNKRFTADEMLKMQLNRFREGNIDSCSSSCWRQGNCNPGEVEPPWKSEKAAWVNEHLMPSSWRLTGYIGNSPIELDFIGAVETIEEDWPAAVNSFGNLNEGQKDTLMVLGKANSHSHGDPRSKLSAEGIKAMCESELYKSEWACFGYDLPEECK